jgi:hypothetical protein
MNIMLRVFLAGVAVLVLSGCSRSASPQFLRGNYYMTGDSNCRLSRHRTDDSITCYDSDDNKTGYRNAMTDQQLEMYRYEKQETRQAIKDFGDSMDELGKSMQQNRPRYTNCYRTYGGANCTTY